MTKTEIAEWATTHYGAIYTALSNLSQEWDKIASDTPQPGEEWVQEMARHQAKSYSTALREFEQLF